MLSLHPSRLSCTHIFFCPSPGFLIFSLHDELRYKVMDACLCGTSPLIVFPFFLSHCSFSSYSTLYLSISPQPPEYIKTLSLFYLYVNAAAITLLPALAAMQNNCISTNLLSVDSNLEYLSNVDLSSKAVQTSTHSLRFRLGGVISQDY